MKSIFAILLSGIALLPLVCEANQVTPIAQVSYLESWTTTSGDLYVNTTQSEKTNPASCPNKSAYILPENTPQITKSMLLTAVASEQPLILTILGRGCFGNRPQMVAAKLLSL